MNSTLCATENRKLGIVKTIILSIAIICVITISYCVVVVVEARSYTEKIIKTDLKNRQWRRKGESPRKYELNVNDLSKAQEEALIAVQDPAFYEHNGSDLSTSGAGITTISQAIAKKLYFEKFKPGFAKLKQTLIAVFVIDSMITKKEQLEIFINLAYLGSVSNEPVYGFESAAKEYYKKSIATLGRDEYLSLVAMLITPSAFSVIEHPVRNKERVEKIKNLISGSYVPKGLMDLYYGEINVEAKELPTFSKF